MKNDLKKYKQFTSGFETDFPEFKCKFHSAYT